MATGKSRAKKPEHAALAEKTPSEVHKGFAAFIAKATGVEVSAENVALVQRAYPLYLKTPEVVKAREEQQAARAKAKADKDAEKKARLRARLDKIEAERQAVLARMGVEGISGEDIAGTPLAVVRNDVDPDPTDPTYEAEGDDGESQSVEVSVAEAAAESAEDADADEDDDDWGDDEDSDESDDEDDF